MVDTQGLSCPFLFSGAFLLDGRAGNQVAGKPEADVPKYRKTEFILGMRRRLGAELVKCSTLRHHTNIL